VIPTKIGSASCWGLVGNGSGTKVEPRGTRLGGGGVEGEKDNQSSWVTAAIIGREEYPVGAWTIGR
jgi:hypothetical protein